MFEWIDPLAVRTEVPQALRKRAELIEAGASVDDREDLLVCTYQADELRAVADKLERGELP